MRLLAGTARANERHQRSAHLYKYARGCSRGSMRLRGLVYGALSLLLTRCAIGDEVDVEMTVTSSTTVDPLVTSSDFKAYLQATATELVTGGSGCPAGYWCDATHAYACPLNTYNPSTHGDDESACLPCPDFEVASEFASTSCMVCPAGKQLVAPVGQVPSAYLKSTLPG